MGKTHVSDISEFVNAAGELKGNAHRGSTHCCVSDCHHQSRNTGLSHDGIDTGMGCRRRGCQGTILASLRARR